MKTLNWSKSTGVLRYGYTRWYAVLDCCPELGRLYRTLFHYHVYQTRKIQNTFFGNHITVVRDEEPKNQEFWKKYNGELIEFEYSSVADNNDYYHWLPVICPRLDEIRTELGLPPPEFPYHMTFGNELIKPENYGVLSSES